MTLFPIPDEFYADPQFLSASPAAVDLWTRAGSWSAHHLTDGLVPSTALPVLRQADAAAADELVALGIWKRTRGGFQYVAWPRLASRAHVEAKRDNNRERQQRFRTSQGKPSRRDERVTNGVTTPVTNTVSHSAQSSPIQSIEDGSLGGKVPEVDARVDEPPTRCSKHANDDNPPPCRGCGDARRASEAHRARLAEQANQRRLSDLERAAQAKALAIADCDLCDDNGYAGGPVPCDHDPDAANRAARGRAAVAAALGRKGPS